MIDDFIRRYQNRVPKALANRRDPDTGQLISQNQDGFVGQPSGQAEETYAPQPTNRAVRLEESAVALEQEPETDSQDQNQDGFDDPQPIIDTETEEASERYSAALNLLAWLDGYGQELQCLPNGLYKFNRIVPIETISQGWKQAVKEYDPELREILCYNDPQPASSSDSQNQDGFSQPNQLVAQHNTYREHDKLPGLGIRCDICHYNEAVLIWHAGKHYCQACHEKAGDQ